MRSDNVKKGLEKAPSRSLLRAAGVPNDDMNRPFHRHREFLERGRSWSHSLEQAGGRGKGSHRRGQGEFLSFMVYLLSVMASPWGMLACVFTPSLQGRRYPIVSDNEQCPLF